MAASDAISLDPGFLEWPSLHFVVYGYDLSLLQEVSQRAEEVYEKIMQDTGLYSFIDVGSLRPWELYPVALYANREEYLQKTRMPEWSQGALLGNAIHTFPGAHLSSTLAHEMSHLIFHEFMRQGLSGVAAGRLRWLNEGLAMYEELQFLAPAERSRVQAQKQASLKSEGLSFEKMRTFEPQSEEGRLVHLWYLQVESVVRFLVERGGRLGFSIFLKELRSSKTLDQVLPSAFPGKWSDLTSLEATWRASL
ncbi:MAG: hypothetical protein HY402_06070 [Elusimicrobia bacterium]|nr:hypothetical protein [Elusimicrobiota bacterium]